MRTPFHECGLSLDTGIQYLVYPTKFLQNANIFTYSRENDRVWCERRFFSLLHLRKISLLLTNVVKNKLKDVDGSHDWYHIERYALWSIFFQLLFRETS
jgi:hypothetical protein